jgi:hypothetical protein
VSEAIERRMAELRQLADDYAKARANTVYLEEFRKSKLAILMKAAEAQGVKTSAAQERDALAHPDYVELLQALKAAVEVSERSRWLLKIAEMGAEIWRTQESTRRAEMKGYGS